MCLLCSMQTDLWNCSQTRMVDCRRTEHGPPCMAGRSACGFAACQRLQSDAPIRCCVVSARRCTAGHTVAAPPLPSPDAGGMSECWAALQGMAPWRRDASTARIRPVTSKLARRVGTRVAVMAGQRVGRGRASRSLLSACNQPDVCASRWPCRDQSAEARTMRRLLKRSRCRRRGDEAAWSAHSLGCGLCSGRKADSAGTHTA
mmetsp:Transcript_4522/g.13081  ORF Transcript_4522/g.13081 Transcript_4522/m.13081 type:complete len:203 (-) Transcript_4522:1179-1787(-)